MPALVDKLDDKVNLAYGGWPDRLCVIGVDGRITYTSGMSSGGFRPDDWERAIQRELAKARSETPAPASTSPPTTGGKGERTGEGMK